LHIIHGHLGTIKSKLKLVKSSHAHYTSNTQWHDNSNLHNEPKGKSQITNIGHSSDSIAERGE